MEVDMYVFKNLSKMNPNLSLPTICNIWLCFFEWLYSYIKLTSSAWHSWNGDQQSSADHAPLWSRDDLGLSSVHYLLCVRHIRPALEDCSVFFFFKASRRTRYFLSVVALSQISEALTSVTGSGKHPSDLFSTASTCGIEQNRKFCHIPAPKPTQISHWKSCQLSHKPQNPFSGYFLLSN